MVVNTKHNTIMKSVVDKFTRFFHLLVVVVVVVWSNIRIVFFTLGNSLIFLAKLQKFTKEKQCKAGRSIFNIDAIDLSKKRTLMQSMNQATDELAFYFPPHFSVK